MVSLHKKLNTIIPSILLTTILLSGCTKSRIMYETYIEEGCKARLTEETKSLGPDTYNLEVFDKEGNLRIGYESVKSKETNIEILDEAGDTVYKIEPDRK